METTSSETKPLAVDRGRGRKGSRAGGVIWMLLAGAVSGAAMGSVAIRVIGDRPASPPVGPGTKLLVIASLPVCLYVILLAHELGHVLGGRLAGFRFLLLIVGPLQVRSGAAGLRFSWNRSLALAGGLAACFPVGQENFRRRMLLMVAGGPLASLLLAIAAGLAWSGLRGADPWDFIAAVTGMSSLTIAIATLIPARTSGLQTDGAQILGLMRGDRAVSDRAYFTAIMGASMSGIRPRDWDPDLVSRLAEVTPDDPNLAATAGLLLCNVALDRGDLPAAEAHVFAAESAAGSASPLILSALGLERAYLAAVLRHDAESARRFRDLGNSALIERHTRLRVDAAIALAEGQHELAGKLAEESIHQSSAATDVGTAAAERDWIRRDILATLKF